MLLKLKNKRNDSKSNAPGQAREEEGIRVHYTYYYYPDIEIYFQLESGIWFYCESNEWHAVRILPAHHRKAQMQSTYKVKLFYTGTNPTLHHSHNKQKYPPRSKLKKEATESMPKARARKARIFYIPIDKSDLVAYEIDSIEMNVSQN